MPNTNLENAKNNMKTRIRNRVQAGQTPRDLGRLAKSARFVGLTDDAEVETDIDTQMAAAIPAASVDDLVEMSEGLKELRTGAADMGRVSNADNLTEGGNKFLKAANVQPAISVSGDLSYDSGVVSYTAPTSSALQVVATVGDLPTGASPGDQAVVQSNNKLYIRTADGWYATALINTAPTVSGNDASYTLATDGTPTVITMTAVDPENDPVTFTHSVTAGALNGTTVDQTDNVFTITPHASNETTFELTFSADDSVNVATAVSSFSLVFVIDFSGVSRNNPTLAITNSRIGQSGYNPANPQFGRGLAISGNTIVASAPYDAGPATDFAVNSGALHIIDATTGTTNHIKYYSPDSDYSNKYNFVNIAATGDYVLGRVGGNHNVGHILVYSASSGNLLHTLDNPIGADRNFGTNRQSVAASGNYAVVGANASRSAYVFDLTTGNLLHTINHPPNLSTSQYDMGWFGERVAIDGDYIAIGSPDSAWWNSRLTANGGQESSIGSVAIWRISTQSFLTDRDFSVTQDVGITGNAAAAGHNRGYNGVAYYDLKNGDSTTQSDAVILHAPWQDRQQHDKFGHGLALKDGMLYVGTSPMYQTTYADYPSASLGGRIFKYSLVGNTFSHIPEWTIENKDISNTLSWQNNRADDRLGYNLSTDGVHLLASSPYVNGNEGAAYIFDVTDGSKKGVIINGTSGQSYADQAVLSGNTVVVSAYSEDSNAGKVRVWKV